LISALRKLVISAGTPALTRDLAANPLATALAPYHAVGENLVRAAFLDARVRDMYED